MKFYEYDKSESKSFEALHSAILKFTTLNHLEKIETLIEFVFEFQKLYPKSLISLPEDGKGKLNVFLIISLLLNS